ncbi:hypothetical protein, partial [Escherichia coli]
MGYSLPTLALGSLALGCLSGLSLWVVSSLGYPCPCLSPPSLPSLRVTAVTDTKGVKAAFDRSVTVGVHYHLGGFM